MSVETDVERMRLASLRIAEDLGNYFAENEIHPALAVGAMALLIKAIGVANPELCVPNLLDRTITAINQELGTTEEETTLH